MAQDDDSSNEEAPRQKLTRDEAAQEFATYLLVESGVQPYFYGAQHRENVNGGISHKSEDELGTRLPDLIKQLAGQWKQPKQVVKVQSEGNKTATVVVEDNPILPSRPFSLIEENGSWGVDLIETCAKWNNFEGTAKAELIYEWTDKLPADLPRTPKLESRVCLSNMREILFCIKQYTEDHDENYPPAKNWRESLLPYAKNKEIFDCPGLPAGQHYGYAYSSKLSSKSESLLEDSQATVALYETTVLQPNAYGVGENRALRHDGGSNYAFADGHVEWFKKSQTPNFKLSP